MARTKQTSHKSTGGTTPRVMDLPRHVNDRLAATASASAQVSIDSNQVSGDLYTRFPALL